MKVLVTGAKGFVGGYIVEKLLENNFHVIGLDNETKYGVLSKSYDKNTNYKYVNGDWDNWYIELYEEYPCNNKELLEKREGEISRLIGSINKNIAGRTKKEWYDDNKVNILENKKTYYNENKVNILEKTKKYRDENRDKIKEANRVQDAKRSDYLKEKVECEKCKSIVSRHHLLTHTRSNKCLGKL